MARQQQHFVADVWEEVEVCWSIFRGAVMSGVSLLLSQTSAPPPHPGSVFTASIPAVSHDWNHRGGTWSPALVGREIRGGFATKAQAEAAGCSQCKKKKNTKATKTLEFLVLAPSVQHPTPADWIPLVFQIFLWFLIKYKP